MSFQHGTLTRLHKHQQLTLSITIFSSTTGHNTPHSSAYLSTIASPSIHPPTLDIFRSLLIEEVQMVLESSRDSSQPALQEDRSFPLLRPPDHAYNRNFSSQQQPLWTRLAQRWLSTLESCLKTIQGLGFLFLSIQDYDFPSHKQVRHVLTFNHHLAHRQLFLVQSLLVMRL